MALHPIPISEPLPSQNGAPPRPTWHMLPEVSRRHGRRPTTPSRGHAHMSEHAPIPSQRRQILRPGPSWPPPTAGSGRACRRPGSREGAKVLDFLTGADVAKAEAEGEVVSLQPRRRGRDRRLARRVPKRLPKIKTSYCVAQTGALYAKITAERSAGRLRVRRAPALRHLARHRLPEEGRLRASTSPRARAATRRRIRARPAAPSPGWA